MTNVEREQQTPAANGQVYAHVLTNTCQILSESTGAPVAVICLKLPSGQKVCGTYGIDIKDVPTHFLYNLYTLGYDKIFEVPDTLTDIRFSQNPLVNGPAGIRYYAATALYSDAVTEIGVLCIMSPATHILDVRQRDNIAKIASISKAIWRSFVYQADFLAVKHLIDSSLAYAVLNSQLAYTYASADFCEALQLAENPADSGTLATDGLTKDDIADLQRHLLTDRIYTRVIPETPQQGGKLITYTPFLDEAQRLDRVFVTVTGANLPTEENNLLQLTEELSGTGICTITVAAGISHWTSGIYKILDFAPDEQKTPNETIFDHVIPEDRNVLQPLGPLLGFTSYSSSTKKVTRKTRDEASTQLASSQKQQYTFKIRTRQNTVKCITVLCTTENDKSGAISKLTCLCKEQPQEQPKSETVDHLMGPIYGYLELSLDNKVLHANKTVLAWLGCNDGPEKLHLTSNNILDKQSIAQFEGLKRQLAAGAKQLEASLELVGQDGQHVPVHGYLTGQCGPEGELLGIKCTFVNITSIKREEAALKESELMYRSFVEELPQMLFLADVSGKFTFANSRLKKVLGYDDKELIGQPFTFIYEGEWQSKATAFYQKQLYDKVDETTFIFPITIKTGQTLWIEQVCSLVRQRNRITGYRFALHDITERLKAQEAMEEAARLATEAKEMQQTFLGKMSHEIRTPMNGVVGMVNLLHTTKLTAEQREYVDSIKESSVNMIRIINDILDVTKIQSGKLVFEETEFVLKNLVNGVIFTLKAVADQKDIQLLSQIDSQIPDSLIADPVRLNQILLNLADNALKFTDKGSVSITVLIKERKRETIVLEFIVSDTGIGIPQNKLNTIFDSFTQAQSDTTRKYGGTGLGLTIAKQLIEQQGGEIRVASQVGKGTTFSFTFTFKQDLRTQAEEQAAQQNVQLEDLTGANILLVEDNVMNQRVAKYTIEKWGAKLAIADSGFKALDMLQEAPYDLILMDIQMPDMNGLQTTSRIRKELKNITPIMAMTASVMQGERENCMKAGMNDYISKPFNPNELNKKIAELLKGKHSAHTRRVTNIAYLKGAVGNDVGAVKEILELYLNKTPQLIDAIDTELNSGKYDQVKPLVHNLKNSVGVLGADQLFHLIDTIEFSLTGIRPSPEVMSMISQMKALVKQSITEVNREYGML